MSRFDNKEIPTQLANIIESSARYLVTRNGAPLGTFYVKDDALLFADELATLDVDHCVADASCEISNKFGAIIDGYKVRGGELQL